MLHTHCDKAKNCFIVKLKVREGMLTQFSALEICQVIKPLFCTYHFLYLLHDLHSKECDNLNTL